jgi:hypothetical protein
LALLGLGVALALSAPAQAETVNYPGATLRTLYSPYGVTYLDTLAPSGDDGTSTAGNGAKSTSLTGNSVTRASGGATDPDPRWVFGAVNWRDTAAVSGNQVFVTGGTVTSNAIGASHELQNGNTSANDNHLTVSGGTLGNNSFGGFAASDDSGNAQARNNTARITGGTHTNAYIYGGEADANGSNVSATATGNSVTLEGGSIEVAYGGGAFVDDDSTATATGNTVDIRGGTVVFDVLGASVQCGASTGNASSNTVIISGGSVHQDVFGGTAYCDTKATASSNMVDIRGGQVLGKVYGGYAFSGIDTAEASNNTVKISGAPDLTASRLYGGYDDGATTSISTGNTLQLATSGQTVKSLENFQRLVFDLTGTAPVLTVINAAFVAGDALTVAISAPGVTLNAGDTITLIHASTLNGSFTPTSGTLDGYAYTLSVADDELLLTIGERKRDTTAGSSAPTLGQGALAALALLLTGLAFATLRRGARRL